MLVFLYPNIRRIVEARTSIRGKTKVYRGQKVFLKICLACEIVAYLEVLKFYTDNVILDQLAV